MLKPFISLIIPAHNEEAEIKICLNSILKQDLNKKYFEVIVVDNASTDSTAKIIKKYPFRYVFEPKKSVVAARQKGVDVSKGGIIVTGDADTRYPKDWLRQIKKDFDEDPKLVGVVGWVYYRGTSAFFNMSMGLGQKINLSISKHMKKFSIVFAANFAFKRWALIKIGGYPKHLPELGDQQYILKELLKLGKVIVDPKVKCFTSSRQLKDLKKNILVFNGWHRLVGYPINLVLKREVIGAKPTIRKG